VVLLLPSLHGRVKLRPGRAGRGARPDCHKKTRASAALDEVPHVTIPLQSILDARQGAI